MIIFGHYSAVYKRFTAGQLGISEEGISGLELQVRQRYAHIFWIPIFPIGKIYAIKKPGDSQTYEMPYQIKQLIQQKQQIGTPWYSFLLPIIAAVIGLFLYASSYVHGIESENRQYVRLAESKMMAKYPTTGDHYLFKVDKNDYSAGYVILKVVDYDKDNIEMAAAYYDIFKEGNRETSLSRVMKQKLDYAYHRTSVPTLELQDIFKGLNDYGSIKFQGREITYVSMQRAKLEDAE